MKESLLWQITHPSSGVKHFVFGTMHVRNDAAYSHTHKADKYLKTCSKFAGEMNLHDEELLHIQDYFELPQVLSLHDLLGDRKYDRYSKIILKAFNIDIGHYIRLKPMILTNMISEQLLSASHETSLDQYMWDQAEAADKEMYGLESAAQQIEILKAIPLDLQVKMLKDMTQNVSRFRKNVFKLSKLYEEGKVHQLYKSAKRSLGKLRKPLLYTRNHKMADRIVELTKDESLFVAVGAAHLSGRHGVLRLLKKSGYKLRAL